MGTALKLGLALASPPRGGAAGYSHYIDGGSGDDGNDGLSPETAWATLAPAITMIQALPDNGRCSVYVAAGTYTDKLLSFAGDAVNAGVYAKFSFEAGTVMQGTSGVDQSWLSYGTGSLNYTVELVGLGPLVNDGGAGLRVTGFDTGSGNALGGDGSGGALMIARNIQADGCVDGFSLHGTNVRAWVYDCKFSNCSKAAFAHVNTGGGFEAYRSVFAGKSGGLLGIGADQSTGTALWEDCQLIPATAGQGADLKAGTFRRGRIGTLTVRVALSAAGAAINDAFVNLAQDINQAATFTRCYGLMSLRMRNGTAGTKLKNCILVGPATGSTSSVLYANFDPGSSVKMEIEDTVLKGYSVAVGSSYTATYAGYWVAALSTVLNCCLNSNTTNIDADIVAAAAGAGYTAIANNITADPKVGPANSYVQADYAVASDSPCIGAGIGGGNIGFTA